MTLKKGAQLLKCGRRGKPKFCPFRLSTVGSLNKLLEILNILYNLQIIRNKTTHTCAIECKKQFTLEERYQAV